MLILNRRAGESIVIDGRIVVTVLQVDGDRIKIGVAAPREVAVLRRELCEQVEAENRRGVVASESDAIAVLNALRDRLMNPPPQPAEPE